MLRDRRHHATFSGLLMGEETARDTTCNVTLNYPEDVSFDVFGGENRDREKQTFLQSDRANYSITSDTAWTMSESAGSNYNVSLLKAVI